MSDADSAEGVFAVHAARLAEPLVARLRLLAGRGIALATDAGKADAVLVPEDIPTITAASLAGPPVICLVEATGSPAALHARLDAVIRAGADAVVTVPLRPDDLVAQIACAAAVHRQRLLQQRKIEVLETHLRHRRMIERAVDVEVRQSGGERAAAYERMRRRAMDGRVPLWEVAAALLGETPV